MSKKRLELLEAIKASGWKIIRTGPGSYFASHPSSDVDRVTPEYVSDSRWGSPTYRQLRHLAFNADAVNGVTFVQSREGVPWTGRRDHTLTLTQAFAYLAEEVEIDNAVGAKQPVPVEPAPEPAPEPSPAPQVETPEPKIAEEKAEWTRARQLIESSGAEIKGFSLASRIGEFGAHVWAREVTLSFTARMGQLTSAAYTDQEVTPRREHQSQEFRNVLTLRCDAGTVVLFNDPHARGVTQWFATVPGKGTQRLEFRWMPSTSDLGYALYRVLRPLSG